MTGTFGRIRKLSPVIKSAVSYPMRYGYRTGMSLAMFAIVIFSVTSMATLVEVMDNLYSDQDRLAGAYEVTGFAASDLNPIEDLSEAVDASAARDVVERVGGAPSVGKVRSASGAEARLASNVGGETEHSFVTGLNDDFVASNGFDIALATAEYTVDGEVDSAAVWRALRDNPRTTVVSALMVPARNQVAFKLVEEQFTLHEVEGLFLENEVMDPIQVVVQDEDSGEVLDLTVIGVLDNYASSWTTFGVIVLGAYVFTLLTTLLPARQAAAVSPAEALRYE